ncbi:MAG: HAMP domain-containing histidine kinase, partial [Cyclobacteriaceae bacterium]|nr:HAMP domain-containing histidine kinase [Cyclobacteriaceae bacterium]
DYKPEVIVSTKLISPSGGPASPVGGGQGEVIQISVKDNGPGIPDDIKDKIFQPFFTTKPTGSGTGLGLSLSYDIIKSHGGTLKIEKREEVGLPAGQAGSTFIILIPTI